ncbi:MAG: hypothetical protein WBI20_12045 [Burkholderiaceae bacterium]
MLKMIPFGLRVGLLGACLLLTACANLGSGLDTEGDDFERSQKQLVGELPLPKGARLVSDQSLILGGGNNWAGRIVLSVAQSSTETFAYFREHYPVAGWTLVSSTRAKNSILVFFKQDRTATVEITEGLGLVGAKSQVTLTIAPRSTVTEPPKK